MIAKRGYKVRVLNQPLPTTTAPTTATTSTQMQTTGFTTTAIPVRMHKLATGQFAEASNPMARSQSGGHLSVQNPPPLEDIPKAQVRQGTPWPNAGLASKNLFKTRKDWPIPPTPVPTPAPTIKIEEQPKTAAIHQPWQCPNKPQKSVHGDHTAPFAKMKKNVEKRIGMAIYEISQGCTPKTFSPRPHKTLSHRTSNAHSHKPFKLKNKTFSNLSPTPITRLQAPPAKGQSKII